MVGPLRDVSFSVNASEYPDPQPWSRMWRMRADNDTSNARIMSGFSSRSRLKFHADRERAEFRLRYNVEAERGFPSISDISPK